jgi:hypothetical protein
MTGSIAPPDPARSTFVRIAAGLATAVLVAFTSVACTGDEKNPPAPESSTEAAPKSASLEVTVARVAGTLSPAARANAATRLTRTIKEYVDNALLGDYPRSDFASAFSSFTKGAAKQAAGDRDLLTGTAFADADSVTPKKLAAKLSLFAPKGTVAGATARVRFVLDVDGTPVVVAGRLLLTKENGAWRIFGYDLRRDGTPATATTEGQG